MRRAAGLCPLLDVPLTGARIAAGHDRAYCMTGSSGNLDAIHLWRSPDLKRSTCLQPALRFGRAERRLEASGALFGLLQHEMDHPDGILAVDRAIDRGGLSTREEYQRRYRATGAAPAASV